MRKFFLKQFFFKSYFVNFKKILNKLVRLTAGQNPNGQF